MTNPLVRIIKKNNESVEFQTLDGTYSQSISIEEFNQYFKVTNQEDIYEMILTSEVEKLVNEQQKRFKWLIPHMPLILMAMNKQEKGQVDLKLIGFLGHIVKEYGKNFPDCTLADFINEVQSLKNYLQQTLEVE